MIFSVIFHGDESLILTEKYRLKVFENHVLVGYLDIREMT
jgi:hypothetical protein